MFNSYKNLMGRNLDAVDNNKLFIINRWASYNEKLSINASMIDRLMLKCDKDILKGLMAECLRGEISKFLKADKEDQFLIDAYKKHYGFSNREYQIQKHLIDVDLKTLAIDQAWDKKMCKKYKIEWNEPKKQRLKKSDLEPKKETASVFDF